MALFALLLQGCAPTPKITSPNESPRTIALGDADRHFVELLGDRSGGGMQAGAVALQPGQTVGMHDTERYEELLIPLEGRGELRIAGHEALPLAPGVVAFSPPHTMHDVANVGGAIFRYVFVATPRQ